MPHASDDTNPYDLLGVHPSATADEIRLAYRRRAMAWHPDRNPHAGAEEAFKRIRLAYEVLCDPARRGAYDGHAVSRAAPPAAQAPPATSRPRRGASAPDVRRRVSITLDEQLHGRRVELKVTRTEYCTACAGSGLRKARVRCATCHGSGSMRMPFGMFALFLSAPSACTDCSGQGVTRPKCASCGGKGRVARKSGLLRFDLPAGIPPGGSVRVPGHGRRGRGESAAGDLVIQVQLAPHPLFEPDFPHLRCEMPVSIFRALAGGSVQTPTLDGPVAVTMPADVVDGTELRIAGHGLLNGATGKRGDLRIRLRLIRRRTLSEAQRELLAKLERLAANEPAHIDWERRRRQAG